MLPFGSCKFWSLLENVAQLWLDVSPQPIDVEFLG